MTSQLWLIIIIIILQMLSMFFTLAAVTAAAFSQVKLQEIFKNMKKDKLCEKFFSQTEQIIFSASLLVIILSVCIVVSIVMLVKNPAASAIISIVLFAVCNVLVAGLWAVYTGGYVVAYSYPVLELMLWLFSPLKPLNKLNTLIVKRLAGVSQSSSDKQQEEFLNVVEQGKIEGVVDEVEQEMIEHVLELNDTAADEIMTPRTDIVALKIDSDLQTVLASITQQGHSRIPVYEETIDSIVGMVYAKDLLTLVGRGEEEFCLKNILRDAYFVPETKPLRELLNEFQMQKLHIAVVLDEYGGTAGIVTIEDIIEEVVGEITDEYEEAEPQSLKMLDENTAEVDARMNIGDFNDQFEAELPDEEDYDTVGGFVFSYLGYIPKTGETFKYQDMGFAILASEKRKINKIKIQKLNSEN